MIELNPDEQARLAAAAKQEGMPPAEFARNVLTEHLPPLAAEPQPADPIARLRAPALFRQWEEEGTARTPEEAARRTSSGRSSRRTSTRPAQHWE